MTFLFPHLCLKEDLLKLIIDGTDENEIIKWTKVYVYICLLACSIWRDYVYQGTVLFFIFYAESLS